MYKPWEDSAPHIYMGCFFMIVGFLISFPFSYNWGHVKEVLLPILNLSVFWKILLPVTLLISISILLSKKYRKVSEYIGGVAFLFLLLPLVSLLHGIPNDNLYAVFCFSLGFMVLITSFSMFFSKIMLQLFEKK